MSENGTNGNGNAPASNGNGSDSQVRKPSGNGHGGYRPGSGRKTKKLERDYLSAAKRAVSNRQFMEICKKALAEAMAPPGLHPVAVSKSRDFLLKALSVEEQAVKVHLSGSLDSDEGRRRLVLDSQDPATLALVADLANRVYGPKSPPPAAPTNGNGSHEKM